MKKKVELLRNGSDRSTRGRWRAARRCQHSSLPGGLDLVPPRSPPELQRSGLRAPATVHKRRLFRTSAAALAPRTRPRRLSVGRHNMTKLSQRRAAPTGDLAKKKGARGRQRKVAERETETCLSLSRSPTRIMSTMLTGRVNAAGRVNRLTAGRSTHVRLLGHSLCG